MRKTIQVEALKIKVNSMLNDSYGPATNMVRMGYINLLEDVLHETGNYKGFRYLYSNDMKDNKGENELPGVNFSDKGVLLDYPMRFENTDDTRRYYY